MPAPLLAHPRSRPRLVSLAAGAFATLLAAPAIAFAPAPLADTGPFRSFAIGALPGGGYLVVWEADDQGSFESELKTQRLSPAGFPTGPVEALGVAADSPSLSSVAVGPSGAWAVFWTQPSGADQIGVGGAFFAAAGDLQRVVVFPDPIPDPGQLVISGGPLVVAFPGGGYAVAFTVGIQEDPLEDPLAPSDTDVYLMRLDGDGDVVAGPVMVHAASDVFEQASDLGLGGGRLVVGWRSSDGTSSDALFRIFDLALEPLGEEIVVSAATLPQQVTGPWVGVGGDGSFVAVWQHLTQSDSDVRIRAFAADGDTASDERSVHPGGALRGAPDVAVTTDGTVWVSWVTATQVGEPPPILVWVRPFDLAAQPLGEPRAVGSFASGGIAPRLVGGTGGALVAWRPAADSPLVVGTVVGPAGESGTPPDHLGLESAQLPGFRVWVRITDPSGAARWGTEVATCLEEALCAAGALPDRAEVVVRVVGPKPNGLLWPMIARLSTSTVEVWVEQLSTGDVRYYLLPAGELGSELLIGRFDSDGFVP